MLGPRYDAVVYEDISCLYGIAIRSKFARIAEYLRVGHYPIAFYSDLIADR